MNASKIRVLHCVETIGSGGVEQRRVTLARYLDPEVFEQQVICSYIIGDFHLRLENLGVKVTALRGLYHLFNLRYYVRLIVAVRKYRPHIIHGAVFEGVVSAVVGGLFCRVPVIIIEETSDSYGRSWRGNFLMKLFSKAADRVIGISPSVTTYLQDVVGVHQDKLRLVNNGVEQPRTPKQHEVDAIKVSLGIKEGDFVVGSVGRLIDEVKRYSDLVEAVKILKHEISELKLLIVGDGPDRDRFRELVRNSGISDRILMAGFQEDPSPFYSCMNLFSLVSSREGFGLVLVEAMYFKLPVIGTRTGGIKDIVVDQQTGLLVSRSSPQEIAAAIRELYHHPQRRKEMGEAGYARAEHAYGARGYASRIASLYKECCDAKNVGSTKVLVQ